MGFIKETNCGATIMYGNVKETNGDFAAEPNGLRALNASFRLPKNPEELRYREKKSLI